MDPGAGRGVLRRGIPVRAALLRQLGALLVGASWTPLREELARRRVEALLGQEGSAAAAATADASSLMARIKGTSQVQYRRLVEGRMDEDDLARLLKKTRGGDTARSATTPEQTKGLTAATTRWALPCSACEPTPSKAG